MTDAPGPLPPPAFPLSPTGTFDNHFIALHHILAMVKIILPQKHMGATVVAVMHSMRQLALIGSFAANERRHVPCGIMAATTQRYSGPKQYRLGSQPELGVNANHPHCRHSLTGWTTCACQYCIQLGCFQPYIQLLTVLRHMGPQAIDSAADEATSTSASKRTKDVAPSALWETSHSSSLKWQRSPSQSRR